MGSYFVMRVGSNFVKRLIFCPPHLHLPFFTSISFPLLYFNFRSVKDLSFKSLIRFERIINDSAFSLKFSEFLENKKGDLVFFGGRAFCKVILIHSSDFNVFYMIQQCTSQFFEISLNEKGRTWFIGGNNSVKWMNFFVLPSALQC